MTFNQTLNRRADIQSLRALAIAIVVAAHAHVPGMQGGYVGVDVFFVLSGYLISSLVLIEAESTRRFDALAFYARRLKRLLPALLLVLLCVSVTAWLLTSPQDQGEEAAAGQAAAVWLSNFYFAARTIGYFSHGLNGNFFLHTWSLGVEEQFYLVWPWLFLFLFGIWSWQRAPFSRKRLAAGLGVVFAVSLGGGWYWSNNDVDVAFYLMPGRAWEFALGALTGLLRSYGNSNHAAWLARWQGRSVLNSVGLVGILVSTAMYKESLRYPGLWALLPCFSAALILLDAPEKNPKSLLSRFVLREPRTQFLGNISYSLYLWHWPILIIGSQLFGKGATLRLGAVALAILLAGLTYVTIEKPIHRLRIRKPLMILAPSLVAMVITYNLVDVWQGKISNLLHSPEQEHIQIAIFDTPAIYHRDECDSWYRSAELSACVYGPSNAHHTVVMFGDSILVQWFPAVIDIYLTRPDWRVVVLTKSACSASDVSYYYDRIKSVYNVCNLWRQRAIKYVEDQHPDVVIMGSDHYYFTKAQWITGTRSVLNRIGRVTHTVVLMSPTPELPFDGLDCLSVQANWPKWLPSPKSCKTALRSITSDSISSILHQAVLPYRNAHVIDLRDSICPKGICRARVGSNIVYRDSKHLTASFVRTLGPALRKALDAAKAP